MEESKIAGESTLDVNVYKCRVWIDEFQWSGKHSGLIVSKRILTLVIIVKIYLN